MSICNRIILWTIIALGLPQCAAGATWYAASDGDATNGSYVQPWSIWYAATNGNPYLAGGDTVIFKNGSFKSTAYYPDPYTISNSFMWYASGSEASKITYRAESLWGFTFQCGMLIPFGTSNLCFWGLRVSIPEIVTRNKTNAWEMPAGFSVNGSNVSLLHNLVENCGQPGIWSGNDDLGKYFAGNVVRFVGYYDWSLTGGIQYDGDDRGEGFYLENLETPALIVGNIVYCNLTGGMLLKNGVEDFRLTNNIIAETKSHGILFQQKHDPCEGVNIVSNFVFMGMPSGPGVTMGNDLYADGWNGTNANVFGNYIVGHLKGLSLRAHWQDIAVSNNIICRLGLYGDGSSDQATEYNTISVEASAATNSPTYRFGGNAYYSPSDLALNYSTYGNSGLDEFTNTTSDVSSSYSNALPTGLDVFVVQPSSDSNFVHVAVFNWQTNASASIDLSDYFDVGSRLIVYDSQNVPTAYTNLTYNGDDLLLPLTLTNRAEMLGEFTSWTSSWTGFDPRFRAFVVYRGEPISAQLGQGTLGTGVYQ